MMKVRPVKKAFCRIDVEGLLTLHGLSVYDKISLYCNSILRIFATEAWRGYAGRYEQENGDNKHTGDIGTDGVIKGN